MLITRRFRFPLLFLLFLAFGKNTEAAISTAFPKTEEVRTTPFSKKEKWKKKRHILKKWKAKFFKNINSKERRKDHFGRKAMFIFLYGLGASFLVPILIFPAVLTGFILGIIGLFKDEDKVLALFAIITPLLFIAVGLFLTFFVLSP